ncbi:MAG: YgiQ family radical SAM protein, partial [Synergistaceae bacterium]
THNIDDAKDAILLPSFDEVSQSKESFAKAFKLYYNEQDPYRGKKLIQDQGAWFVVQNQPSQPLTEGQIDSVYSYPYTRAWHPDYDSKGGIPALEEVGMSITSHRGCFGECAFCALVSHQGRIIQSRSHGSIIAEAKRIRKMPGFKGYIHDVGGPTANFRKPACQEQFKRGACLGKSCLYPSPCRKLEVDHTDYINLLRKLREMPGIKKVFVRSGLRYDYILADKKNEFLEELCKYHISGQLKIAPEHVSRNVLKYMRKAPKEVTSEFIEKYRKMNEKIGMKQFLVPYFMSAHPGSTLKEALELAEYIRDTGIRPEQVQDFTPTPGSISTCMYHTGIDPMSGESVYVPKTFEERKLQRALLQYWMPENAESVRVALRKLNREDLIGYGSRCLVSERRGFERLNTKRPIDKKR